MRELRNDREAHLVLERQPRPRPSRLQAAGAAAFDFVGNLFLLVLGLMLLVIGLAAAEHEAARKVPACEREQLVQLDPREPSRCRLVKLAARGPA